MVVVVVVRKVGCCYNEKNNFKNKTLEISSIAGNNYGVGIASVGIFSDAEATYMDICINFRGMVVFL